MMTPSSMIFATSCIGFFVAVYVWRRGVERRRNVSSLSSSTTRSSPMSPRKNRTTEEELADLAAQIRVSDPTKDNGAFSSLTNGEVVSWLMLVGVREMDPALRAVKSVQEQKERGMKKLRLALWDIQRLDLLFPDHVYSETPNLRPFRLPSWPGWKEPHDLGWDKLGTHKMDGYADAERLNSYFMTHFNMMAFTQTEIVQGISMNPPKGMMGTWIGTKKIMAHASLDITRSGGKKSPFVSYFSTDKGPGTSVLVMEILDVKQVSWPEPGPKFLKQLKESQEVKFGDSAKGPLNPMMQTPKVPLVIVRYSYMEGRPEGGSQFMLHLEFRYKEIMPPGTTDAALRREFEKHLGAGEEMPEEHIRMFARLLSNNADLVDPVWSTDLQSHWHLSKEAQKETRISFFVPCPRIRFRALEEIETGNPVVPYSKCGSCGKDATKLMCSWCKAICYCNSQCAKNHWSQHKAECKTSKKILDDPSSLPEKKLYIPACSYVDFVVEYGFANQQEAVKMGGTPTDDCSRNEYGPERFICRAIMPIAGKAMWDPAEAKMKAYDQGGGTAFLCDRRRSVSVRLGNKERVVAREQGIIIPFHEKGYNQFVKLMTTRGMQGQLLYVWTRRVGDCLEVDLEDIPEQNNKRWD